MKVVASPFKHPDGYIVMGVGIFRRPSNVNNFGTEFVICNLTDDGKTENECYVDAEDVKKLIETLKEMREE